MRMRKSERQLLEIARKNSDRRFAEELRRQRAARQKHSVASSAPDTPDTSGSAN
ncbi:MAG: hypothetical protein ACOC32_04140 [Nanoarchaeota archaeon]